MLHVIRTIPSDSSWDSTAQPKNSSTWTRRLITSRQCCEVVEHLALRRQVGTVLTESPLDVPGGEHGMWLMQSHVRVGVDPHAADAFPPVDQDDFLIARQVLAGDEECIQSGDAGSHDANIAGLYGGVWLCDSGHRILPPLGGTAGYYSLSSGAGGGIA